MANFGDQLRSAPEEEARRQKAKRDAELRAFIEKERKAQRQTVDTVIRFFKEQCTEAARQGKRCIDCKPDATNVSRSGAIYIGFLWIDLMMNTNHCKEKARNLIPEIERVLSTMGLKSYQVSIIKVSTRSGYNTLHYVGFRIKASW